MENLIEMVAKLIKRYEYSYEKHGYYGGPECQYS